MYNKFNWRMAIQTHCLHAPPLCNCSLQDVVSDYILLAVFAER